MSKRSNIDLNREVAEKISHMKRQTIRKRNRINRQWWRIWRLYFGGPRAAYKQKGN
jgi:hypothetical protein